MTDLNAIASNVNANAAKNGVNSDITSLTALVSIAAGLTITGATLTNPIINNPTITGGTATGIALDSTSTVPTAPTGTNTTEIASTAFVTQAAFATVLPAQPGGVTIFYLQTQNGVASWSLVVMNGNALYLNNNYGGY